MNFFKKTWLLLILALLPNLVFAHAHFKVNDTVLAAFPSNNIKDDAYILGIVRKILPNGDYQVTVQDYVKGHNYGISCAPMPENEAGEAPKVVWNAWKDKTQLYGKGMQYLIKKQDVAPVSVGQHYFIERNNLLVNFNRWLSNQFIMPLNIFHEMEAEAAALGLKDMVPVIQLAEKERASYYAKNMVPRIPSESIVPLNKVLKQVRAILKKQPKLNKLWRSTNRSSKQLNASSYTFFMIKALDKIVDDANRLADKVETLGEESVHPVVFNNLKKQLKVLS